MALPPLEPEELEEQAELIVVGSLTDLQTREVPDDWGTRHLYRARVVAQQTAKGELPEGLTIEYWSVGKRPAQWGGPCGQMSPPPADQSLRLYLTEGRSGWTLLEPNGWSPQP